MIRYRGDTVEFDIQVTNESTGAARDITGETLTLELAQKLGMSSVIPVKNFTITDALNGLASLELTPSDTANLNGTYYYLVKLTTAAGKVYTIEEGTITFKDDIS